MVALDINRSSGLPWHYSVTRLRVVSVIVFSFYALLCLPPAFSPGRGGLGVRVLGVGLVGACVALVVRGWRCGTVIADERGLTYRSLLRTKWWSWEDIARHEGRDGRLGVAGYRRRILWLVPNTGDPIRLTEVNLSPARGTEVDRVAKKVNEIGNLQPQSCR
jgi:hypothetical protein